MQDQSICDWFPSPPHSHRWPIRHRRNNLLPFHRSCSSAQGQSVVSTKMCSQTLPKHEAVPPASDVSSILINISGFSCEICGKQFSQRQGVLRHKRREHNSRPSCLRCGYEWTRPDQYRAHLEKQHPEINPDRVLNKSAGSRGRSKIIGRDLPLHLPPPAIVPDGPSQAEPLQPPMLPPPPATSLVAYNQPEHAELAITTYKPEVALGLELLSADALSAFPSLEEWARLRNDLDFIIQGG